MAIELWGTGWAVQAEGGVLDGAGPEEMRRAQSRWGKLRRGFSMHEAGVSFSGHQEMVWPGPSRHPAPLAWPGRDLPRQIPAPLALQRLLFLGTDLCRPALLASPVALGNGDAEPGRGNTRKPGKVRRCAALGEVAVVPSLCPGAWVVWRGPSPQICWGWGSIPQRTLFLERRDISAELAGLCSGPEPPAGTAGDLGSRTQSCVKKDFC